MLKDNVIKKILYEIVFLVNFDNTNDNNNIKKIVLYKNPK